MTKCGQRGASYALSGCRTTALGQGAHTMGAVLSHTSEVFESLCRYDFLTQVLAVEPDGRERVDPVT